jgi:hypothetical protein
VLAHTGVRANGAARRLWYADHVTSVTRALVARSPVALAILVACAACAKIAELGDSDPASSSAIPKDGGSFPQNDAGAVISPLAIKVNASCGPPDESGFVGIENRSDHVLPYEVVSPTPNIATLKDDDGASGASLTGTLPAHQAKVFHVVVTSLVPGSTSTELFVSTGTDTQHIPIDITVNGALLTLTPPLIDFGQVEQSTTPPPATVELENTGNQPVTVSSWSDGGVDFTVTGAPTIPPGGKVNATVNFVPGLAGNPITAEFSPQTLAATCSAIPTLTLKGERIDQSVAISPGALPFGNLDCNSQAPAPQTITLSNFSPTPVGFKATLPANSVFTATPTTGTIDFGSSSKPRTATISVAMNQVGSQPGDFSDAITIEINGASGGGTVNASFRVVGASLTVEPTTLTGFNHNDVKHFTLGNVGNAPIEIKTTSSDPSFLIANGTDDTVIAPAGLPIPNTANIDVQLVASGAGPYTSTITPVRAKNPVSARLCNTLPTLTVTSQ